LAKSNAGVGKIGSTILASAVAGRLVGVGAKGEEAGTAEVGETVGEGKGVGEGGMVGASVAVGWGKLAASVQANVPRDKTMIIRRSLVANRLNVLGITYLIITNLLQPRNSPSYL
jgi:hypothetical protein